MLSLTQKLSQQQKLTPQQLQFLKLLQLSAVALEQRVKEELEINPLLEEEEGSRSEASTDGDGDESGGEQDLDWEEFAPQGDYDSYGQNSQNNTRLDASTDIPQPAEETLAERLLAQLRLQRLSEEELILAEEIIGNIDADGYLRRDLSEIVDDLNHFVSQTVADIPVPSYLTPESFSSYDVRTSEHPFGRERIGSGNERGGRGDGNETVGEQPEISHTAAERDQKLEEAAPQEEPARRTIADLSLEEMASLPIEELARILERGTMLEKKEEPEANGQTNGKPSAADHSIGSTNSAAPPALPHLPEIFSVKDAEHVLARIQRLDPHGVGARDLRECLLIQLELLDEATPARRLAEDILVRAYHEFTMKHFEKIIRLLDTTQEELREAIELIVSLNPKPGEGYSGIMGTNYVTPDFVIEREGNDFTIIPNDSFVPTLRINPGYQDMLKGGAPRKKQSEAEKSTRLFLRQKMDSAKWFIASIHQRRQTMMRVMEAILTMQREFFMRGPEYLKPMIYKDVAERIGMDISTICRVVNGKYVQTDYGVFELRYFFSEALETVWGEEVSNRVVKQKIREMIESEDKTRPLSDEAISDSMKEMGYNVARRTIAKYREQMNLPVARLRRKL